MKIVLPAICFIFSIASLSATHLRFFIGDRNAMAVVTPTDKYGNTDSDSTDLYKIMNVPEQDTMLGKGKSIISDERDFNMVCGEYKLQCQFILNKSSKVQISARNQSMVFTATGDEAKRLSEMFKRNDRGEVYFKSVDSLFKISGNSDFFIFEAKN